MDSAVAALVLIKDELIHEIIILEDSELLDLFKYREMYPDYQIEDLGEWYICPGIIDLNVCFAYDSGIALESRSADHEQSEILREEEKYTIGSGSAASGGVTTVVDSPSVFHKDLTDPESFSKRIHRLEGIDLYCDVGFLASLSIMNVSVAKQLSDLGVLGFKGYMIPPAADQPYFRKDNLWIVLRELSTISKPLFIHSELTSERFIYINSPFRVEPVESRIYNPKPRMENLPGAFPESLSPVSSEDNTPYTPEDLNSPPFGKRIIDEHKLEKRIKIHFNKIDRLVNAEIGSYCKSGSTIFEKSDEIEELETERTADTLESEVSMERTRSTSSISSIETCSVITKTRTFNLIRRPPKISCVRNNTMVSKNSYMDLLVSAPEIWEENCVKVISKELRKYPQCKVHISNLSSAQALFTLRKKKQEYPKISLTCETTGTYLYYSESDIKPGETMYKTHPPIRDSENKKLLHDVLRLEGVDVISSYHRPVHPSLKFLRSGDFQRAVSGINCLGFTLQAVWSSILGDPYTNIPKIFKWLSENPARVIGLESVKGSIKVGKHADLVIWNPLKNTISDRNLFIYPQTLPFLKRSLKGRVYRTYLRGKLVYNKYRLQFPSGKLLS